MTQPPLSTQIKHLEQELDTALFDRSTRSVVLTPAGKLFLEETRRLLSQLEHSAYSAWRVGKGEVGRLSLGFVPSAASETLPPLLRLFRERFPDVEVSLHEMNPPQLVQALHETRIDAALFYLPSEDLPPFGDAVLESRPVSTEPLVVALPEGHPLTSGRKVELSALAEEPFIIVSPHRGSGLRDIILQQCRKAGFMPHVAQEAALIQTIGGLVASGVGVALVPASLRRLQRMGVSYRSLQGDTPFVQMGVIWRKDDPGAILRAFLEVAEKGTRRESA